MATPFHVELVTPEAVLYSGDAEEVSMRTDGGEIAFLAHHEDYVGAVDITVVRIHQAGSDAAGDGLAFAVHGGFVQVDDSGVTILASVAEAGAEIDVERARTALGEAQSRRDTEVPGGESEGEGEAEGAVSGARSPTMVALLAPESADASARRAQARLEAAGAVAAS